MRDPATLDFPVYVKPKPELRTIIARSVMLGVGHPVPQSLLVGYHRHPVKFLIPDGQGGLKEK